MSEQSKLTPCNNYYYCIISQIRPPFLQTSIGYECGGGGGGGGGALSRDLS